MRICGFDESGTIDDHIPYEKHRKVLAVVEAGPPYLEDLMVIMNAILEYDQEQPYFFSPLRIL